MAASSKGVGLLARNASLACTGSAGLLSCLRRLRLRPGELGREPWRRGDVMPPPVWGS